MAIPEFALTVVLVTASGALAPGPLFFATLLIGSKSGARAGLGCAVGHTLIEFPLVMLMGLGLIGSNIAPAIAPVFAVVGGVALVAFGLAQAREILARKGRNHSILTAGRGPLMVGVLLTGLNPFFLVWWMTVGVKLVLDALSLAALAGVLAMYVFHIWMDYAWLSFTAYSAHRGVGLLGSRYYRLMLLILSVAIIAFGINFIFSGLIR